MPSSGGLRIPGQGTGMRGGIMTGDAVSAFSRAMLEAIETVAERRGASVSALGDSYRAAHRELKDGAGRVTPAFFRRFVDEFGDKLAQDRLASLEAFFKAYDDEMSSRASARSNRLLPARNMKLVTARQVLEKRCNVGSISELKLATHDGLEAFLLRAVLGPAYVQNYGAAINAGQAVVELVDRAPREVGLLAAKPRAAVMAHMTLSLAWIGVQSSSADLVRWSVDRLAPFKDADPFAQAAYWHISGYYASGSDAAALARKALGSLRSRERPAFPISKNFSRSIDAAVVRKGYVDADKPLSAEVVELGEPSVEAALERNVERALESDREGSAVVALVQQADAMLKYGKTEGAVEAYFAALRQICGPSGTVASNVRLVQHVGLRIARAKMTK